MDKLPSLKQKSEGVTRRDLLKTLTNKYVLLGAGFASVTSAYFANELGKRLRSREKAEPPHTFEERVLDYVNSFTAGGLHSDFEQAQAYGNQATLNVSARTSRMEYLRQHFMDKERVIPDTIATELSYLSLGVVGNESRFQNDVESSANATHMFQVTEETLKDVGATREDMKYLTSAVPVARKIFERKYKALIGKANGPALTAIRTFYFNSDQERFDREFMVPLLLSAYHAGEGNTSSVLQWFAAQPTMEKTLPDGKKEAVSGYDVFSFMVESAASAHADPQFRTESRDYAAKVYAFAILLNRANPPKATRGKNGKIIPRKKTGAEGVFPESKP